MKFVCDRCNTRYSIADEKVRQKILRIRCKTCGNVLTVRDDAGVGAGSLPAADGGSSGRAPVAAAVARPPAAAATPGQRPGTGGRLPPPPPPPPRSRPAASPETLEWYLALDGQQKGPFGITDLARQAVGILAPGADPELYCWKESLDGWKPPSDIPDVARKMAELRAVPSPRAGSGRTAPPPPPPSTSRGKPALAAAAKAAPPPAASGTGEGDVDLGAFGEAGDATQIQPLSSGMFTDLARDLADEIDRPTPATAILSPFAGSRAPAASNGFHAAPLGRSAAMGAASPGVNGAPVTGMPVDLMGGALSTPFFPPPVASSAGGYPPSFTGIKPLSGGPTPAESGLSKILGIGGIFVRKPYLKYVAGGAGVLLVGLVVVLAFLGGSKDLPANQAAAAPAAVAAGAEDPDKEAAAQAARWFSDKGGKPSKATIAPPVRSAPAHTARRPARPEETAPAVPVAVTPPPVGTAPARLAEGPTVERAVPRYAPTPERRAVALRGNPDPAPPTAGQIGQIHAVVSSKPNSDAVKSCYARALRQTGANTGGRLEVVVSIEKNGRVRTVGVSSPDSLKAIQGCIKTAVSRWRFPAGPEDYGARFTLVMQSS